ncbi:MAG: hypothetical protein MUF48_05915 [Pirellulaceae bacterium]|jgi:hypothetical protein|nr:hypothetical protein [Pirellulaceae bacterium]
MLRKISLPILLAVVALAAAPARAADWGLFLPPLCWPECFRKLCCDDYCPKPLPCVPRVSCFGCDDYQGKCAPCVRRLGCFGCDDYCPKCPPAIRCAPAADLKCVPLRECR